MIDPLKLLNALKFLQDADNYEDRKVARNEVAGLIVSTAYTSDEGYETALIDAENVYPVERYSTREAAIDGHLEWMKKAETIVLINRLGAWEGLVEDKMIALKRKSPK